MKVTHMMPLIMFAVPGLTLAASDGVSVHPRNNYDQPPGTMAVHEGTVLNLMTNMSGLGRLETTISPSGNNMTQLYSIDGVENSRTSITRNGNQVQLTSTLSLGPGFSCTTQETYTETKVMEAVENYQQGTTYGMTMEQSGQGSEDCAGDILEYTFEHDITMSETIVGSRAYSSDTYSNQDCIVLESGTHFRLFFDELGFDLIAFSGAAPMAYGTYCAGVGLVVVDTMKLISISPVAAAASEIDDTPPNTEPFYNPGQRLPSDYRP